MAERAEDISVIIPVRKAAEADALLQQFSPLNFEVIVSNEGTRAKSLNLGAAKATRKFLWFLHADSFLPADGFEKLQSSLQQNSEALHYFDLAYAADGPGLTRLNAWGANIRSHVFGAPFGDQGLCIRKDLFFKIGGYREDTPIGEDHLFVWQARRHGIKLQHVSATITTSAKAYEGQWLGLTLKRQWIWMTQALPQAWKLLWGR